MNLKDTDPHVHVACGPNPHLQMPPVACWQHWLWLGRRAHTHAHTRTPMSPAKLPVLLRIYVTKQLLVRWRGRWRWTSEMPPLPAPHPPPSPHSVPPPHVIPSKVVCPSCFFLLRKSVDGFPSVGFQSRVISRGERER